MSASTPDPVTLYGWTAVPRDPKTLLHNNANNAAPKPMALSDLPVPSTPLAQQVQAYAHDHLPLPTYNHSMRVYRYALAIAHQQFPSWIASTPSAPGMSLETLFCSALLHDIGTTPSNLRATRLSFEFYGGMLALELLRDGFRAPVPLAESVAECVMRHQDLGETGTITAVGKLIHFATIFDNMGEHEALVHRETIENVVAEYPRLQWSKCFAATIREENGLKPWAHTTALGEEDFPNGVLGNKLMAPYE